MIKDVPETNCDKECKFKFGPEFKTLAYHAPLYDKTGKLISTDTNTTTGAVDCIVCNKHWAYIATHKKTTFTEWNGI